MSSQITPYRLTGAYESFLAEFQKAIEDGDGRVLPSSPLPSCFRQSGEKESVDFEICLYVKKCPCRQLPHGKRLDIAIKARERLEKGSWSLTKSTVYVNYFVLSGSVAQLVRAVHYDFEKGGQTGHPFFHAQLSDEAIADGDLRSTGFDLTLKLPEESNERCVGTRIPTPDMTLASVLYCLVADHLGAAIFTQFANNVHSIEGRLPPLSFDAIKESLQRSVHFKSSHWFAHMQGHSVG